MIIETLHKEQAVQACPDGWTCINCGDEYSSKTVDVKDYYVTYTKEGTLCRKCQEKKISHSYKITKSGRLEDVLITEDT